MTDAEPSENTPEDSTKEVKNIEEYAGVTQYWLNNIIAELAIGSMLVRETKQKASIKIQRVFRDYVIQKKNKLMLRSAVKIQKTWRGFMGRRRYYKILRKMMDLHINADHHRAARMIQAAFRGYYSRKYIHDQEKLRQLRIESARELLQCVAIKSRELLKNHQIPGVCSLRNSTCLAKVEKLVASLRTRTYNESVKETRVEHVVKLRKAFEKSIKSKNSTEMPFGTCTDHK